MSCSEMFLCLALGHTRIRGYDDVAITSIDATTTATRMGSFRLKLQKTPLTPNQLKYFGNLEGQVWQNVAPGIIFENQPLEPALLRRSLPIA